MRLLLSKPDSLGDQFIAAGIVQALRNLQPDTRIVWHVRSGMEVFAPLIGADVFTPRIDEAPEAEAARLKAHPGGLLVLPYPLSAYEPWSDDVRTRVRWWVGFLRATSWDATVLGLVNRTWVGDLTAALAPAPVRIGFAANAARQPLVNEAQAEAKADAPTFTTTLTPSFTRSEAAQLRDLFAILEPRLNALEPAPVWKPSVESTRSAGSGTAFRSIGREARQDPGSEALPLRNRRTEYEDAPTTHRSRPRIIIAPGVGADPRRAWGVEKFRQVADALRARRDAHVSWLEGPDDAAHLEGLPQDDAHPRLHFDRDELPRLLEALRDTDLFLCHDTAYAHIAAGLGLPTVAIYGAGQSARFHPSGGLVKIVQSEIACAGCQWHCLWDRLVCVADIPVDAVLRAAEEMLSGNAAPVAVSLATPVSDAPEGEAVALKHRLQSEVLALNADRFARLQIIQSLLAPSRSLLAGDSVDKTDAKSAVSSKPSPASRPVHEEPRISVIIPMGRPERVAPTLAMLAAQQRTPANWEIVLVGVEAASVARAHPHLPIRPVVLERNELPTRTRCIGVEHAHASVEWFWFVDDDVEPAPECYARFLTLLGSEPFATAAAPPVGAVGFRIPGKSGRFFERVTDVSNFWSQQSSTAGERDWLYSATLLVRADAYRKSGGFNPELPNGEDVDLTRRIAAAGYRLRYEPQLVARHDHHRDTLLSMWSYFWKNGNAARYYFAAHGGACPFSVKTVWLKAWSDLQMNLAFQRRQNSSLGLLAPLVWLNYLIVETSLDCHWQGYIQAERRYLTLPARAKSDRTFVRAMTEWDDGRRVRGALLYALAVIQDFANPVRR